MDWKTDRNKLREEIKKNAKEGGFTATFLYVLISHMRGKIHMRYHKKYRGGWRGFKSEPKRNEIPKEFTAAYGECALQYYNSAVIETLKDQEEWIRKHIKYYETEKVIFELADRVINAYNDQEALVA